MKKIFIALGLLLLVMVAFYAFNSYIYNEKQAPASKEYQQVPFTIDGEPAVVGENGVAYFGNEIRADLDNDGEEDDMAFLVTNQPGGSGTFYYVVAAVHTDRGYIGSDAYFLGDRIAPQATTGSEEPGHVNVIAVYWAERAPGEPMTAAPSVGNGVLLKLDPDSRQWGVVAEEFEGEAAPEAMTLQMQPWTWVSALYNDGTAVAPNTVGDFVLTFENERFSAKTDCNSMAGTIEAIEGAITFSDIVMTRMFCENSKEGEFAKILENAAGYHFTSKGELILDLKFDSGTATFR